MIAALYVEKNGPYFGLTGVDPWDKERDARLYAGPWPVVAHPPCARWCQLAGFVEHRFGYKRGDDGGCFAAALDAVRTYGGVLEHPAYSLAWSHYGLPAPTRYGWATSLYDPGYSTEIAQVAYGHPARKRTWLYVVGCDDLPALDWTEPDAETQVSDLGPGGSRRRGDEWEPGIQHEDASRTPLAFRDSLIAIAMRCDVSVAA